MPQEAQCVMLLSMACLSACWRTRFHVVVPVREVAMVSRLLCCSPARVSCAPSPRAAMRVAVSRTVLPGAGCGGGWGAGSEAAPSMARRGRERIGGLLAGRPLLLAGGGQ